MRPNPNPTPTPTRPRPRPQCGLSAVRLAVAALAAEEVLGHLGDDDAVRLARLGHLVHAPLRLVRHLLHLHAGAYTRSLLSST